MDKTIFLCGFMGCGKTTVGTELAKMLGCKFTDLDELIVSTEGRTIPEIFATNGEGYFRALETSMIKKLSGRAVVALGGGAVMKKENAEAAKRGGVIVFIDTDFDTCFSRICGDSNRPLAANADKSELMQRYDLRYPVYKEASDIIVPGSGSPKEIAAEILRSV